MTKFCSACKAEKPVSEFTPITIRGKAGFFKSTCKPCSNLRKREWSKNNRPKINAYRKRWRKENPEKAKKADDRGHALDLIRNPNYHKDAYQRTKAYKQEYERQNAVRLAQLRKEWRKANPEKCREYWNWQNYLRTAEGQHLRTALEALRQLTEAIKNGNKEQDGGPAESPNGNNGTADGR